MTLAELKAMIEAEALRRQAARDGFTLDAVKGWLGQGAAPPPGVRTVVAPPPDPLHYRYFADLQWKDLVRTSYRCLLDREPDAGGEEQFLRMLALGEDKAYVIGRIAYSAEGRQRGRKVAGLFPRFAIAQAKKLPVAGRVIAWVIALAGVAREQRNMRAFQQHVYARLDAIGEYSVQTGERVAMRIDALRAVLETRD